MFFVWLASACLASAAAFGGRGVVVFVTPPGALQDPSTLVKTCVAAARGGAAVVQLRDPGADGAAFLDCCARVCVALRGTGARVVVNTADIGVALAAGADGVHLREAALGSAADVGAARGRLAAAGVAAPLVGASAHSVAAVLRAADAGCDYVQLGTMFETQTHPGKVPEGPALMRAAAAALAARGGGKPLLVGVGGIDASNCARVAEAGADGVAVIRGISASPDPAAAVAAILEAMRAPELR